MTSTLYTTGQVAKTLDISAVRVRQLAARLGVGQRVGRDWIFTDAEVERLRLRNQRVGRPKRAA